MASERGEGQTEAAMLLGYGLQLALSMVSRSVWEGTPKKVRVLYAKTKDSEQYPEYCGTRGIPWEYGGTTLQA